jgi:hypothetical protein
VESVILAVIPIEDARHLCRELHRQFGDGFDMKSSQDPTFVEVWGPGLARDFSEGYVTAIQRHTAIQRSGEYAAVRSNREKTG